MSRKRLTMPQVETMSSKDHVELQVANIFWCYVQTKKINKMVAFTSGDVFPLLFFFFF